MCKTCKTGYGLVSNRCVLKNIDNCVGYVSNPVSGVLTCSECRKNFGLKDNLCIQDLQSNCKKYADGGVCVKCKDNYHLTTLKNGVQHCIQISSYENCKTFNSSEFELFRLKCTECDSNFVKKNALSNHSSSTCNLIQNIPFCVEYDMQTTFAKSTLNCTQCEKSHYLQSGKCKYRDF